MNPIREAAEQIKGHWHQGYYHTDDMKKFCGVGMMRKVVGDLENVNPFATGNDWRSPSEAYYSTIRCAGEIMDGVAAEQFPDRMEGVESFVSFNDHPETTEDEVIAVLEKAAVKWDERI